MRSGWGYGNPRFRAFLLRKQGGLDAIPKRPSVITSLSRLSKGNCNEIAGNIEIQLQAAAKSTRAPFGAWLATAVISSLLSSRAWIVGLPQQYCPSGSVRHGVPNTAVRRRCRASRRCRVLRARCVCRPHGQEAGGLPPEVIQWQNAARAAAPVDACSCVQDCSPDAHAVALGKSQGRLWGAGYRYVCDHLDISDSRLGAWGTDSAGACSQANLEGRNEQRIGASPRGRDGLH